jgi:hypothetical protein
MVIYLLTQLLPPVFANPGFVWKLGNMNFFFLDKSCKRALARMLVPKMVKNGFNSVLVVSAVFRVDRYS